jgi:hypothetical protein
MTNEEIEPELDDYDVPELERELIKYAGIDVLAQVRKTAIEKAAETDPEAYDEYKETQQADIEEADARRGLNRLEEEYEDPELNALKDKEELAATVELFGRVADAMQEDTNDLHRRLYDVREIEQQTDFIQSPEGRLDRLARENQSEGETYEQAYARQSLAHPELAYDGVKDAQDQRRQMADYRRKRDSGQL